MSFTTQALQMLCRIQKITEGRKDESVADRRTVVRKDKKVTFLVK